MLRLNPLATCSSTCTQPQSSRCASKRIYILASCVSCKCHASEQQHLMRWNKQVITEVAAPNATNPSTPLKLSAHIKRQCGFFEQLQRVCRSSRGEQRYRALVAGASTEQLLCLVECALNILRSRVPLGRRHLTQLRNQAKSVRQLSKVLSGRAARALLLHQQTGRGLPALAGLFVRVLLPVLLDRAADALLPSSSAPTSSSEAQL